MSLLNLVIYCSVFTIVFMVLFVLSFIVIVKRPNLKFLNKISFIYLIFGICLGYAFNLYFIYNLNDLETSIVQIVTTDLQTTFTLLGLLLAGISILIAHYMSDMDTYRGNIVKKAEECSLPNDSGKIKDEKSETIKAIAYPRVATIFGLAVFIAMDTLYMIAYIFFDKNFNIASNLVSLLILLISLLIITGFDFVLDWLIYPLLMKLFKEKANKLKEK